MAPPNLTRGAHDKAGTTVEKLGADYFQDPYSVHERLRAERPVSPVIMPGGTPVWLVTGYAEARAALADPRLGKNMPGWHPPPDSIFAALDVHMLNSDPPDHESLRWRPSTLIHGLEALPVRLT